MVAESYRWKGENMERNEVAISRAKVSMVNSARDWMKHLVEAGATPEETKDVIDGLTRQVSDEAKLRLAQREPQH
jgi:hypothetical protein